MSRLIQLWPAAGLRASSGNLELRWITDELMVLLADVAGRGIHHPDLMPFTFPWTRGSSEQVARGLLSYQWSARSTMGPNEVALEMAVLVDGEPIGVQAAGGKDFSVLRTVETGSWMGQEFQGRGLGTKMRALMLHLLFDGLGTRVVTSTAYADNPASNRVSLKTGYEPDGSYEVVRDQRPTVLNRYVMTAQRFATQRVALGRLLGAPVTLEGTEAVCKQLAG